MPGSELNREIFLAPKWQPALIIKDLHGRIFLECSEWFQDFQEWGVNFQEWGVKEWGVTITLTPNLSEGIFGLMLLGLWYVLARMLGT